MIANNGNDALQMNINASLSSMAFFYNGKITALRNISLSDIALSKSPPKRLQSIWWALGKRWRTPRRLSMEVDVATKNQDGAWLANVKCGLQYSLRWKNIRGRSSPISTLRNHRLLPTSWGNANKGISKLYKRQAYWPIITAVNATWKRWCAIIISRCSTPFHTINTDFQWATRFYHKYDNLDSIKSKAQLW